MNEIAVNGEFNFHEQEVLSIFYETNVSGRDEKFAELVFTAAFAIRSMSNLGVHEVTDALGQQLQVLARLIDRTPAEMLLPKPKIVDYPGHNGRKRFIVSLRLNSDQMRLDYSAKGFGFFSIGIGYYAPAAVSSLFRYYASRRIDDDSYLLAIADVAEACGQLQLHRQIQMTNHPQLVLMLIRSYMEDFIPDWMQ
ncbi:hypothetical protein M4951_23465 [Blastopirellula sp. J2-11]|uniref:hypothetical protein n=1 Tax=Blastopirellula sp. J2-11 TaxID=2943192 RepID=UPI0021C8EA73|nr:hypothetical protein [Blastopirellula sp. J2-11]UUO06300.1 hypothetical protein M4951_23465 [Blastopirellula sp. J2-11]